MISLRLKSGRARKAQNGGYAYGGPAYGYRAENGSLVPNEGEQMTLQRIRDLHSGGAPPERLPPP
jgi:site-specific DNA recombinase